jgi:hypothetical protein
VRGKNPGENPSCPNNSGFFDMTMDDNRVKKGMNIVVILLFA